DLSCSAADFAICSPNKTHRMEVYSGNGSVQVPIKLDPGFDLNRSMDLGRMIENWGVVPLQYLQELSKRKYPYAYIGMQDLTMYPLILPGSFVQIDEERNKVEEGKWRSGIERSIHSISTRAG